MSITYRILIAIALIVGGAFYYFLDKLTDRVERQYLEAEEEPMVDAAHIFAGIVGQQTGDGPLETGFLREALSAAHGREFEARIYNLMKKSVTMHVYVTDREGIVVFDSRDGAAEGIDHSLFYDVARTLAGEYGARSSRADENDPLSSIMYVAAPVVRPGTGEVIGVVSVSKAQASMFSFIDETKREIRWLGWSIFTLILLCAFLLVNWLTRPIGRLTQYARAVERGERAVPPKLGGSEVNALGHAFEEMRDALENRKYVESYVQTLTHEMKSPLAAIRGAAELLEEDMAPEQRQKFLGNIQDEIRRLQQTIDRMLALSTIESRKMLEHTAPVDLAGLVTDVAAGLAHALESKRLRLELDLDGAAEVDGDAFLLETSIANLLQNAIDFSPEGGSIRVAASRVAQGGRVELVIEDEGPGIPDYAVDRVFERFYSLRRPDTGKKSSGLGLCFVREAAELHGGSVGLGNRSDGPGTRAVLRLPIKEAE